MKQRVGDRKRQEVEAKTGRPIRSMWARGGRNPRYWDVYFGAEDDDGGETGYWYPAWVETRAGQKINHPERLEMSDMKWRTQ